MPDSTFVRGARLFDAGSFFEAHEAWEECWLVETNERQRRILQGLIQIAAGFHKLIVMGAGDSASRLLARGLAKLDGTPAKIGGLSICAFRDAVRLFARDLAAGRFDGSAVPKIDLDCDPDHGRDPP